MRGPEPEEVPLRRDTPTARSFRADPGRPRGIRWGGQDLTAPVLGLFLLFGGSLMMVFHWGWVRDGWASEDFPETTGRILESSVYSHRRSNKPRSTAYAPSIRYEYQVEGQSYRSDRVFVHFLDFDTPGEAREILEDFPRDAEVPVFFDPENPGEALLIPGATPESISRMVLSLLACLGGGGLFYWAQSRG